MENSGNTRFLFYDVLGQQCPSGMTIENCGFRGRLQELYNVERLIDYRVLEKGIICVSRFVNVGESERFMKVAGSTVFDLNLEKWRSCSACKKNAKQLENCQSPGMQTIVYAHTFKYVKCPKNMVCETCPLRKELNAMESKKSIGYRELDNGKLLLPKGLYNHGDNTYQDFEYLQEQICGQCLQQQTR